uniref:Cytochrome c oxidase subunit III n=1 Tax=Concholepas concholepas TaxID=137544 RepID=H9D1B8_CONCC|nr:cytochrome c oxidase subunit III [Concholepas concholepas]AFC65055.1 cytochrome c oxidase subunit III [Concholepas concholepas]
MEQRYLHTYHNVLSVSWQGVHNMIHISNETVAEGWMGYQPVCHNETHTKMMMNIHSEDLSWSEWSQSPSEKYNTESKKELSSSSEDAVLSMMFVFIFFAAVFWYGLIFKVFCVFQRNTGETGLYISYEYVGRLECDPMEYSMKKHCIFFHAIYNSDVFGKRIFSLYPQDFTGYMYYLEEPFCWFVLFGFGCSISLPGITSGLSPLHDIDILLMLCGFFYIFLFTDEGV